MAVSLFRQPVAVDRRRLTPVQTFSYSPSHHHRPVRCHRPAEAALAAGRRMLMMIPHAMLSPDALRGLIEAFVTREGTDYGLQDMPLATKVFQVQQQLD